MICRGRRLPQVAPARSPQPCEIPEARCRMPALGHQSAEPASDSLRLCGSPSEHRVGYPALEVADLNPNSAGGVSNAELGRDLVTGH